MRYKVFVSNDDEYHVFYVEDKEEAMVLFNMAKHSDMFTYAEVSRCEEECYTLDDWSDAE